MPEGRAIGRSMGGHQHQAFLVGEREQFFSLRRAERDRRFAKDMLPLGQRFLGIPVMIFVRRCYIDGFAFFEVVVYLDAVDDLRFLDEGPPGGFRTDDSDFDRRAFAP